MTIVGDVLPALALAGAVTSAVGTVAGGVAQSNASNYQAEVATNNAKVAEYNATRAEQAGAVQTEAQGRKGAAALARTRASMAANGIDVNSGSAEDVQVGEREAQQLDTETVMSNANLQSYGYRVQGGNFKSEAALDQSKADAAIPGAVLSAGGGLLSKAAGISTKWSGGGGGGEEEGDTFAPEPLTGRFAGPA